MSSGVVRREEGDRGRGGAGARQGRDRDVIGPGRSVGARRRQASRISRGPGAPRRGRPRRPPPHRGCRPLEPPRDRAAARREPPRRTAGRRTRRRTVAGTPRRSAARAMRTPAPAPTTTSAPVPRERRADRRRSRAPAASSRPQVDNLGLDALRRQRRAAARARRRPWPIRHDRHVPPGAPARLPPGRRGGRAARRAPGPSRA